MVNINDVKQLVCFVFPMPTLETLVHRIEKVQVLRTDSLVTVRTNLNVRPKMKKLKLLCENKSLLAVKYDIRTRKRK